MSPGSGRLRWSGAGAGLAALLLGAAGAAAQTADTTDTTQVVLTGRVSMQEWRGGAGLPAAIVEVRQGAASIQEVTDQTGRYRVEGLAAGEASLQVRHMAAEPHEMRLLLPRRGSMVLDVELERRAIPLPTVLVRARRPAAIEARPSASLAPTGTGNPRVRLAAIESTSGVVESGLARAVGGRTPGNEDQPPEHALFMRGSTVDSRMVLLDGAPVLTPFHLAGLVPSFDARSLGAAAVHLGGAPARFEGGLSYVLDARTRPAEPDAPTVEAALDGLAVRGGLNLIRSGRAGLVATGRAFHGAQAAFTPSSSLPYHFRDLLVRGDMDLGGAGALRATWFENREGVVLGGDPDRSDFEDGEVDWGNRALSLGWEAEFGETRIEALAAAARYDASLPVVWDAPILAGTRTDRYRTEVRLLRPWADGVLSVGAGFERQEPRYYLTLADEADQESVFATRLATDTRRVRGGRAGIFGEFERPVLDRVHLRLGTRLDHFDAAGGLRISPRGALRVEVADDATFTVSAGRFHQYVAKPGLLEERDDQSVSTLRWDSGLTLASATHLVMELEQAFSPTLSLGVSGFVKRFFEEGAAGSERVNASGTDLRLTRQGDRLDGWVGYALSWFWVPSGPDDATADPGSGRSFSGRHLLTTGIRYRDPSGLRVGASLEYGAGLPLTEIPLSMPEESGGTSGIRNLSGSGSLDQFARSSTDNPLDLIREDDFMRLDLEAAWVTHPVVAGHRTEMRPYIRILNALDRRDALFYYFDRWRDAEISPIAERPLLPLMGLEWRF